MPNDAAPSYRSHSPSNSATFLTVEEAAVVLRIGRTAAYLLARRWEDTDGVEGLPVVRFGRLLRVPVHELERLAAGPIDVITEQPFRAVAEAGPSAPPEPPPSQRQHPRGSPRKVSNDQASLFPEGS